VLSFAICDSNGSYVLNVTAPADSLVIKVSQLGYGNKVFVILGYVFTHDFILEE